MGKIIYNIKKKRLYEYKNPLKPKKAITPTQELILLLLSDNKKHTYEDIMEFVYKMKVEEVSESEKIKIRVLISRVRKKLKTYKKIEILKTNEHKDLYGSFQMKGELWLE